MVIELFTLCWNEAKIIPYVIDYWKHLRSQVDGFRVTVFDNCSSDDSERILSRYDWIDVRHFESNGLNDIIQRRIKDDAWKEARGRCDFVIVCDLDEVLYSVDLRGELNRMKEGGYNVLGTPLYTLCGDCVPLYRSDKLLHESIGMAYCQRTNVSHPNLAKFMLFDPNITDEMNPSVGWHLCNPSPFRLYESGKVFCIHIDKGLDEDFFVERRRVLRDRLSNENKRRGYSLEYSFSDEEQRKIYRENQAKAIDINEVIICNGR